MGAIAATNGVCCTKRRSNGAAVFVSACRGVLGNALADGRNHGLDALRVRARRAQDQLARFRLRV
jgi:hypothetical protein